MSVPFELLVLVALLVLSRLKRWPAQPFAVGAFAYVVLLGAIVTASVAQPALMERLWTALFAG